MASAFEGRLSDLELIHPYARERFRKLEQRCKTAYATGECRSLFLVFETLRLPQRQEWLKRTTNSTKVGAWGSTHQYGLAVDFVAYTNGRWSWDDDEAWEMLDRYAAECGLVRPIRWDRPHIEHPRAGYLIRAFKDLLAPPVARLDAANFVAGWLPGEGEVDALA